MSEKGVQTDTARVKTAYGSCVGRSTADIAYERCETLALLAESTVQLSPEPMACRIAERFGSDDVYLYHYRQDGVFVAHASWKGGPYIELLTQSLNNTPGLAHSLVCNSEPIIVDYRGSRLDVDVPQIIQELGYTCSVLLPVVHGGELFGVVRIMYRGACPWHQEDVVYLRQVGRLLGASASRIYKSEKEAELKVLDERRMIAAEIHDDAAQLASSLSISSDTVRMAYELGNTEAVEKGLRKIAEISSALNNTLRDQLVSLRVPLENSNGLIQGIQDGLRRLESQWGIQTHFSYDQPVEQVSMRGEVQLMRVVTECFSNIVKHAGASHVDVSLVEIPRGYLLVISDDGCGFDVSKVPEDRFGLKIMRERIAMANGVLDIESTPKGTTVTVAISRL